MAQKKYYTDKKTGKRKQSMYYNLNEGTFTAWCNKHGKSDVQSCASQILKNKSQYSSKTVKRAQFAKNQKKKG